MIHAKHGPPSPSSALSSTLRRGLFAMLAAASVATVAPAHALQGGEDPDTLPVLIDKRFGMRSRHQFSVNFATALATKYVEASGVLVTYDYNFRDWIGLEIGGGYLFGSEASIMDEVRLQTGSMEPDLNDLYQLQWMANANLMFVPVYGKISFASEFDPSYDIFLTAGGGVGGIRKQFGFENPTFESKVTPMFNFGGGLRFYVIKELALRAEFRNYFFPDPKEGMTFNLMFQGGLQFQFGGS
jgi:outer membrane beta-barrel protein